MNKRYAHHLLTQLRAIKHGYLLAALFASLAIFILAYRQNNVEALRLRDELLRVDQRNGDVETAIKNLREFTYTHMNANLSGGPNNIYPPIQLKYRYERLVQAEKDRVTAANARLYTDAQTYCEQRIATGRTINRVPCIQEYLTAHGAQTAKPIPDALYKFDFVSPLWSPDLAGWSLIIFLVTAFLLLVRYISERWLRHQLRNHS
jgi:hypothetical protein